MFSLLRRSVAQQVPQGAPFRAVLDDTLLRRSGNKIPGVAWRRDPLGPRFQTNFVRAQRFLQLSAALPADNGTHRMVPIAFLHAPTPPKPQKPSPEKQAQYRADAREARISVLAAQQISQLRADLDQDEGGKARPLIVAFDGGYTNSTVLKNLPDNTICIGRIRQDAALYFKPDPAVMKPRGRRLRYGKAAPTPEQIRVDDDTYAWESIPLVHNGISHQLRYKRVTDLLWRTTGTLQMLQLIVIAPLGYRLRKGSRRLYRQPAFLICTDAALPPEQIIQSYFQRWDIEVNFRDEKTLLGVGQAQVRNESSVEAAPAFAVASYGMLLVASQRAFGTTREALLPPPKWAANHQSSRISTQQMIQQLRADVWGRGLGISNFSGFASTTPPDSKPEKCFFPLASAVCYANS